MRRLLKTFLAVVCLAPSLALADSIDGKWFVVGFVGEPWFVNVQNLIGQEQEFSGGFSAGPLYSCDYAGQSMTYTTYANDEFFSNQEFALFAPLRDGMTLSSDRLFVHRITCNGDGGPDARKVLYPFVTNEARASAWYLYEGGVVELYRP